MATQKKIKVFIIDDNEMTRTVLRMIVQGEKYEVVGEANSGRSALDKLAGLRPDIIFLDIMMPDLNGLDLLERFVDMLPKAKVLMVTASNDRETVKKAIQQGASGFIVKPFNESTVIMTIDRVLAQ